jgi:2-amino-4-hydroxy-6-hydroxymethyldihydropteridine diphosphokinase
MLQNAVDALASEVDVNVVGVSSVYETDPVGPPQPDFLNAVIELETELSPAELLRRFKAIESRLGRVGRERWGPREIDIDLLLYGDERIDEPDLRVPHIGLIERAFVLVPLVEIAPDLDVSGAGPVSALLERLGDEGVTPTGDRLSSP